MNKRKLKINFTTLTDAQLELRASQILQCLTGNVNFPDPIPTLAELQAASDAYSEALLNVVNLGRSNVAEKNQCRFELQALLVKLGLFIMSVTDNEAILTTSGFPLAKERAPIVLEAPTSIFALPGRLSGELKAGTPRPRGARTYVHGYTEAPHTPDSVWVESTSSRCNNTYTGLTPGKQYAVRVKAIGSGTQSVCSPVATSYVM